MLVCALAALVPAAASAASSDLVLSPSGLKALGWGAAHASRAAGLRELRSHLTRRADRAALAKAERQSSGVRTSTESVDSYAFVLHSVAAAGRIVRAFERATKAQSLAVGQGGAVAKTASGRATVFTIIFREGARIGLLSVRSLTGDRDAATELAPLADSRLKTPLPATAYQRVLTQVRPDGSVSKQTALQAFALSYGALPGVRPRNGARSRPFSGDLGIEWVLRYYSHLSPRLRSAVNRRLGLSSGLKAHAALYGDPTFKPSPGLTAQAMTWRDKEATLLAHTLGLKLVVGTTTAVKDNDALPIDAKGNFNLNGPLCRIRIVAGMTPAFLKFVLAHEVFHCFEFDLAKNWPSLQAWIMEGLADWAALAVTQVPYSVDAGFLDPYLTAPGTPIFARGYDAAGFWGHVQDITGSLWARIPTILHSSTSAAAVTLAGGETEPFASTWASSQVRSASGGSDWQMKSPIAWPDSKKLPVTTIPDDVDHMIDTVSPYSTGHVKILLGPLVHIDVTGHARLSAKYNYTDLGDGWFCTEAGGCDCPAGSEGETPTSQPLEPGAILALTGDPTDGATADIEAHSLKEFCSGVFVTQYNTASCVGCTAPTSTVLHITDPGSCVLAGGTLTVTLTGDGGSLTITVPGYSTLPKRSDGATVFDFSDPRLGGPDVAMAPDWSSGDSLPPDVGIQIPQGAGHIDADGKGGFLATSMFSPSTPDAGRLAAGDFSCKKPVR